MNQKLIAGLIAASLVVVIAATVFISSSFRPPATGGPQTTEEGTPAAADVPEPAYTGIDTLYEHGIAEPQVESFKYAMYQYLKSTKQSVTDITLTDFNSEWTDPNSGSTVFVETFKVSLDGKTMLNAKLEHFELTAVRLYLTNPAGGQVFDSGTVDNQTL